MNLSLVLRLLRIRSLNRGFKNTWNLVFFRVKQFITHSTSLKFSNFLAVKFQKLVKLEKVWGMPYKYTIDPLNICNLRCPLCPTGLGILKRDKGKMPLANFKQLIDEIAPYAYYVELYNWGEPFLHPQIFEMIHYASTKRISVRLSSNFNYFSEKMAVEAIKSGLDAIIVSLDGATQETYEKYRRKGNLTKVLENIRMLVKEKKRANSSLPFITLRMLVNRYNESEIEAMRELAHDLGVDAFTIGTLFIDTTNRDQVNEWLPKNESLSFYSYSSEELQNVWSCSDLWESMAINWDGGLAPCCWLHDEEHDFGNVFEHSIKEIWNSQPYIVSRRIFSSNRKKEGQLLTICTTCKGRPLYLKD